MTTVSPAKIKAYLATIKEQYLDENETTTTKSTMPLSDRFTGILKMELLLRGVILQDDTKLWTQIQSSVGKNLVEDLPKPLLAGANIMAGRVTEAFCRHWKESDSSSSVMISLEESSGSLQRAKDIEDERWLILLKSEYHNDSAMLQVALGFFTTAAQIQSDTPPMWKKVWDTWTMLRDVVHSEPFKNNSSVPPFEAQVAIENQSRIAQSKGNNKRFYELQLRLALSCLNPDRVELSVISFSANRKVTITKTIVECFGDTQTGKLESNRLKLAEKARHALKDCLSYFEEQISNATSISPENLLFQVLNVQALIQQEEANLEGQADEMYRANQHRSVGPLTLAGCQKKCWESFVISLSKGTKNPFENCTYLTPAIKLRDTLISIWGTMNDIEHECEVSLCFAWVKKCMDRLKDYALVISQKSGSYYKPWYDVLEFIRPLVQEMESQGDSIESSANNDSATSSIKEWLDRELCKGDYENSSVSLNKLSLISAVVVMIPEVYWMMLGDEDEVPMPLDSTMTYVVNLSSDLIRMQQALEKKKKREAADTASAVGAKTLDEGALRLLKWKHAKAMATCFVCQDDHDLVYQVTREAIESSKQNKVQAPLGLMRCLISWAGWYERPWPFCSNLSETRLVLSVARSDQGRPLTKMENLLLVMASADAELLNGGFLDNAFRLYQELLESLGAMKSGGNEFPLAVLQSHCYNGMARVVQTRQDKDKEHAVSNFGKMSLKIIDSMEFPPPNSQLFVWHLQSIFLDSTAYQLSVARQLIAESLMDQGCTTDARSFLEAAVRDSPSDPEAALSFGAFLLRVALFNSAEKKPEDMKAAQVQLLKAAKLDSSKADPFALLGVWFEAQGDGQRALGCFRKSLVLNPCHPVAGRGLLRLQGREKIQDTLGVAIDINSPSNGWAWYAIGLNKAYIESADELAVIAILKGLRCRDIAQPSSEKLGNFLHGSNLQVPRNEEADALAELAASYRRLGRYTASVRSFHASIASAGVQVPLSLLVSCAQIELELGLVDDAAEKFAEALTKTENSVARYGYATALYSMAQRDFADGKVGAAFASLELAIDNCLKSSADFACQLKLLGDLYSLGASFPPNIFIKDVSSSDSTDLLRKQLEFVSKGEEAYRRCHQLRTRTALSDDEEKALKSSYACDIAANILLQAHLLSGLRDVNSDAHALEDVDRKVDTMYERAYDAFLEALEVNPVHAASWCGLGCSVRHKDPLLAQHAFCRSIELDKTSPDAYANLGFLYTSKMALDPSRRTMEVLTQVADTPMMWMNCAFILEREVSMNLKGEHTRLEASLYQAADAYRAALQVMKHPAAQLGLSMTSRMQLSKGSNNDKEMDLSSGIVERKDSLSLLKEYSGASILVARPVSVLQGIMQIEMVCEGSFDSSWKHDIFEESQTALTKAISDGEVSGLQMPSLQKVVQVAGSQPLLDLCSHIAEATTPQNVQVETPTHPDRPEAWLSSAKAFIDNDKLDKASEAARKAVLMFSQNLHSQRTSHPVDATRISEAISLDTWLKNLNKEAEEEKVQDQLELISSFNLQRALFMDPGNTMARRGLRG
jgi:tetratricopeptide (TPR) repeat protein